MNSTDLELSMTSKGFVRNSKGEWSKPLKLTDPYKCGDAYALATSEAKVEKDLQEQVSNYLRQKDIWFCRSGMHRKTSTPPGTPDFIFCQPLPHGGGFPTAIECKSGTGKLTPDQEQVRKAMTRNGWRYYVIRSLPELIRYVKRALLS